MNIIRRWPFPLTASRLPISSMRQQMYSALCPLLWQRLTAHMNWISLPIGSSGAHRIIPLSLFTLAEQTSKFARHHAIYIAFIECRGDPLGRPSKMCCATFSGDPAGRPYTPIFTSVLNFILPHQIPLCAAHLLDVMPVQRIVMQGEEQHFAQRDQT